MRYGFFVRVGNIVNSSSWRWPPFEICFLDGIGAIGMGEFGRFTTFRGSRLGLSRTQILAVRCQCQSVHRSSQVVAGFSGTVFPVVGSLVFCVISVFYGIWRK